MQRLWRCPTAALLVFLARAAWTRFIAADLGGSHLLAPREALLRLTPKRGDHLQGRRQLIENALTYVIVELSAKLVGNIATQRQDRHDDLVRR